MLETLDSPTLIYVHDPMCSWCWAFNPGLEKVVSQLPDGLKVTRIVGGLAPDSDDPMPQQMQDHLQSIWRTIEARVPGTQFNYDFWALCEPRRSTYPACRAVIAARKQGESNDEKMTRAIQQGYYLKAQNPSDNSTLIQIAKQIGLDATQFATDLVSSETENILHQEINLSRMLGVQGFPSLLMRTELGTIPIPVNHNDPQSMSSAIDHCLNSA